MNDWAFITDHGSVLAFIANKEKVRALDIALELGMSERKVRKIIADLSRYGYLNINKDGKCNRYKINYDLTLRRPENRDVRVKELLYILLREKQPM